jgi:hypothetical protein
MAYVFMVCLKTAPVPQIMKDQLLEELTSDIITAPSLHLSRRIEKEEHVHPSDNHSLPHHLHRDILN